MSTQLTREERNRQRNIAGITCADFINTDETMRHVRFIFLPLNFTRLDILSKRN